MTVIVYKDGVMAADSCSFIGDMRMQSKLPKITRRRDGVLLGCAGVVPVIRSYVAWFLSESSKPFEFPRPLEEGDLDALIAHPNGELYRVGYYLVPYLVNPPFALGSDGASLVAHGAMAAGASAAEATKIAIDMIIYVGGSVQVEKLCLKT